MTNNELLDAILNSYLYGLKLKLENNPQYKKLTFEFIAKAQADGQNFKLDKWHLDFLKQTLIDDGFIKPSEFGDPEPYSLTPEGVKAAQTGWYKRTAKDKQTEDEIKKQTLDNLRRSKYSLYISILAIIIPTIISVYSLWTSKQSPTTDQLQELQQRIEKMENLKNEAKTKTDNSLSNLSDTLKMENSSK